MYYKDVIKEMRSLKASGIRNYLFLRRLSEWNLDRWRAETSVFGYKVKDIVRLPYAYYEINVLIVNRRGRRFVIREDYIEEGVKQKVCIRLPI